MGEDGPAAISAELLANAPSFRWPAQAAGQAVVAYGAVETRVSIRLLAAKRTSTRQLPASPLPWHDDPPSRAQTGWHPTDVEPPLRPT
jgi:hypothetical protein